MTTDIFKGFNVRHPEYSVVTPQTGYTFGVRSMDVGKVERLRESSLTINRIGDAINEILWESITKKPDHIHDYNQFLNKITLIDRDALLYGLYISTYGNSREYETVCQNCEDKRTIKVNLPDTFSINMYPYAESVIENYEVKKSLDEKVYDPELEQISQEKNAKSQGEEKEEVLSEEDLKKEVQRLRFMQYEENVKSKDKSSEVDDDGIKVIKTEEDEKESKPVKKTKPVEDKKEMVSLNALKEIEEVSDKKDVINRRIRFNIPNDDNTFFSITLKQPTLKEEQNSLANLTLINKKDHGFINEISCIDKMEQHRYGESRPDISISRMQDLIVGYKQLLPPTREKILEYYEKYFGQYRVQLSSNWICPRCQYDNRLEIDIFNNFFRMVNGW